MAQMSPQERNALRRARWEALSEEEKEREREKQRERRARDRAAHPEKWEQRNKERAKQLHEKYLNDPEEHERKNTYERERYRAKKGLTA